MNETKSVYEWALLYIKVYSVIPVGRDKKPMIDWKEFQTRKATPEEIKAWFDKPEPPNIGIVTGKISGITVVDIEKGGKWEHYPVTQSAKTGGGGYHLYYQYAPGMTNKARIHELTDIRGDGGYCFTAGHRVVTRPKNKQYKNSKSIRIEDLRVGDKVMTFNETTGQIEEKPIIRIGNRKVKESVIIKFGQRQGVLRCTDEHPIYTTKGWKNAGDIKKDDELLHFDRNQLLFGKTGHTFTKGIQNRISKNDGSKKNYQHLYKQTIPSHHEKKSKYEDFVSSIAEKENLPIEFVGDGSAVIKHGDFMLHPDFIVKGKKKVIEVHIDFHKQIQKEGEKKVLRNSSQEERKKMYEAEGWECLLLNATEWQAFNKNTLEVIDEVRNKLIKFVCNGKKVTWVHKIYEETTVYNIEVEDNHNYFIASKEDNSKDWYLVHNCVAPPSSHASGGTYEWFRKELVQPFPYQMFGETPGEYKKKDWQDILVNGANKGERNQTAAQVVGKLLKTLPFEDWMTVAWPMLVHWNASSNPPLDDRELRGVFNSIAGKEMRNHQTKQNKKESTIDEIVQHDDEVKLISSIVGDISDDLEVRYPTGFGVVDKAFRGGLKDGDMWFITGYSGHGKTSWAQTITYNLIMAGQPILWFSYEVLIHEIWRKFKEMGVSNDFLAYSPAIMATGKIDWVEKKIIEARDKFKTKVIFIDHLGFLAPITNEVDANLNSNYSIYLGMICRQLKAIAIREKVAIVLMGHLRKPATGKGEDPTIHDIKDSAAVAQESDAVIIVNRKRQTGGGGGYDGGASEDLYSSETQVKIEKNRVTGETKIFSVEMIKGRLMDFDQRAKEEGFIN